MIKKMRFLRWAKSKGKPVTRPNSMELTRYGERVFAIWMKSPRLQSLSK